MHIGRKSLVLFAGAALALAGIAVQGAPLTGAAAPTIGAIGCANSASPTDIKLPLAGAHLTGAGPDASAVTPGTLSIMDPAVTVLCGVALQDGVIPYNTITGGAINYTVTPPGIIAEAGGASKFVGCGTVGPETCQATVTVAGNGTPAPANTIHVGLMPGTTFPAIGAGATITLSATYTPNSGTPVGPFSVTIPLAMPTYAATLTPSPSTIPAGMNSNAGSTLTASFFHTDLLSCLGTGSAPGYAVCPVPAAATLAGLPGAEPGAVTFRTDNGVFQNQQQVFTVACNPTPGAAPGLSMSSCLNASATLFGGGNAGTADVSMTFVGQYTGATINAATTVALSPSAAPVAGGATGATLPLTLGCNQVVTSAATVPGAPLGSLVGLVQPAGMVTAIWTFDNTTHGFQPVYFADPSAPVSSAVTAAPHESLLVCVSGNATFPAGS